MLAARPHILALSPGFFANPELGSCALPGFFRTFEWRTRTNYGAELLELLEYPPVFGITRKPLAHLVRFFLIALTSQVAVEQCKENVVRSISGHTGGCGSHGSDALIE